MHPGQKAYLSILYWPTAAYVSVIRLVYKITSLNFVKDVTH